MASSFNTQQLSPPQIIDESAIDSGLDARIKAALCEAFPKDRETFSQTRAWHGSHPTFSAMLFLNNQSNNQVIAHVGVVDRIIRVGSQLIRVAGVMNVCVVPSHRGHRLVDGVLATAMVEANHRGMEAGLLFCAPDLIPLYQRNGWHFIQNRIIVRVEDGKEQPLPPGNNLMFYPLGLTTFPNGMVHLQGNDW